MTAGKMFGDWKRDCTSRTLVDSAFAGSQAFASFFSAPVSFDDSGNAITSTTSQKPTTTHLVQLPAGISVSLLATLFINPPSGSSGVQLLVIRPLLRWIGHPAALARQRADHGDDACQRELCNVIDVADHVRASGLEQAQAPVLRGCIDALHVADLPALLNLPAYRLVQRTVHRGQLRRRQAVQVMLD